MKKTINILLFIGLGILLFALPMAARSEGETIVRVNPLTTNVQPGDSFSVDIRVENVTDLYGFDVTLHFNPAHLQVDSLALGSFLSSGFGGHDFNNSTGIIHYYNTQVSPAGPKSGSGTLFRVNFTAKTTEATTPIDVDQALSDLVEYDTYQLIPFTAQDGSVVIGAGSSEYLIFLPLISN
jgi:hypothetical protein